MLLQNIKKVITPVVFLFLLSSCASNSYKEETNEKSPQQIKDEKEAKEKSAEIIAQNFRSAFAKAYPENETSYSYNNQEGPSFLYESEEKRKYRLNVISEYIRKVQIEYNDPKLEGFISWSAAKNNQTKQDVENDLQIAFSKRAESGFVRYYIEKDFKMYEKKMDTYLSNLKKNRCKGKKCSL